MNTNNPQKIDESSKEPPVFDGMDAQKKIDLWISDAIGMADSCGLSEIAQHIVDLSAYWHTPTYRVIFIGEKGRGKSTLINRLLGTDILPTKRGTSYSLLTSIFSGDNEKMQVILPTGEIDTRSLDKESWRDLVKPGPNVDESELTRVRIEIKKPFFGTDVEVIDAPGISELNSLRGATVVDLIRHCDTVILVVTAMTPFGLTEASLLEFQVLGTHVPNILVVVSELDRIPMEERLGLFQVIKARIEKVSPTILVLPSYPIDLSKNNDQVLSQIYSWIEEKASERKSIFWQRAKQVAIQLCDQLKKLIEIGQSNLRATQVKEDERKKTFAEAMKSLERSKFEADQILLEFDRRCLQTDDKFRQLTLDAQKKLSQELEVKFYEAENPKEWYQKKLRIESINCWDLLQEEIYREIQSEIAKDFDWVYTQMALSQNLELRTIKNIDSFHQKVMLEPGSNKLPLDPVFFRRVRTITESVQGITSNPSITQTLQRKIKRKQLSLSDVTELMDNSNKSFEDNRSGRKLENIGDDIEFIMALINLFASILGPILEGLEEKQDQKHRKKISEEINTQAEHFSREYIQKISKELKSYYREYIENVQREMSERQTSYISALKVSAGDEQKRWQDLISKTIELDDRIKADPVIAGQ